MNPGAKRKAPQGQLDAYMVRVQPFGGGEIEQYWVNSRSRRLAMRAAARYAGVTPDRVLGATLHSVALKGDPA
jgi:hypothetical protein